MAQGDLCKSELNGELCVQCVCKSLTLPLNAAVW